MITLKRTNSTDRDFQLLVALLDEDLKLRDGADNAFYAQFNKIDMIRNAVVCYHDEKAVGCGAFKPYDEDAVEIKRMYVRPDNRGAGIALNVLKELEAWAAELHFTRCVLETGKKQPEAIRLYEKAGYARISNYGQYANMENSVCMDKTLK